MNELMAKLEALLFIYGDPLDVVKAASTLGVTKETIEATARALQEFYSKEGRGLALLIHTGKLQLATRPEYTPLLEKVIKAELHESLEAAKFVPHPHGPYPLWVAPRPDQSPSILTDFVDWLATGEAAALHARWLGQ